MGSFDGRLSCMGWDGENEVTLGRWRRRSQLVTTRLFDDDRTPRQLIAASISARYFSATLRGESVRIGRPLPTTFFFLCLRPSNRRGGGIKFSGCQTVTIRYDTRCYFDVRSKADTSQLNLPHGDDN